MSFLIYALAVWRLTSLLLRENGPREGFYRLRVLAGVYAPGEVRGLAELFSCVWCMSVWVAAILFMARRSFVVLILAASAVAVMIDERIVRKG